MSSVVFEYMVKIASKNRKLQEAAATPKTFAERKYLANVLGARADGRTAAYMLPKVSYNGPTKNIIEMARISGVLSGHGQGQALDARLNLLDIANERKPKQRSRRHIELRSDPKRARELLEMRLSYHKDRKARAPQGVRKNVLNVLHNGGAVARKFLRRVR